MMLLMPFTWLMKSRSVALKYSSTQRKKIKSKMILEKRLLDYWWCVSVSIVILLLVVLLEAGANLCTIEHINDNAIMMTATTTGKKTPSFILQAQYIRKQADIHGVYTTK